jgi:hypothetical protein
MPRQKLPLNSVRDFLIDQTTDALRRDARIIAPYLNIRERTGEPNWDANIGIAEPSIIRAFGIALLNVQRDYDVDW